ncbi:MAG: hypothetical protein IKF90_13485 [Parasporobacterium sp.]|nr:hypothetical protein [Parasporobacterium sp.]
MRFNVERIVVGKKFYIDGLSYAGNPRSNTAMFITKKVEALLQSLVSVKECLIFAEEGLVVPEKLANKNAFVFSERPQLSYARFAQQFADEQFEEEKSHRFLLSSEGYYFSDNVVIPKSAYIEPGCVIGPDVWIGENARILAGTIIRHSTIGNYFYSNENAVIGANGFTMVDDECGNKLRTPSLGRVIIGNNVEIGAHDNISRGSGGDTVIEDYVKLDALVYIGHDAHICSNVVIAAGSIIGGFDVLDAHSYIGLNATLRNRIRIGDNALIGMGSTVTKSVEAGITVAGNPARLFNK